MPVANRILFIVADDLGYGDLHPHHAWLRKPALDALAARSRVFSQFRTLSPVCSPSRAAALTGQNPSRYCVRIQFADHDKNAKRGIPDWVTPAALVAFAALAVVFVVACFLPCVVRRLRLRPRGGRRRLKDEDEPPAASAPAAPAEVELSEARRPAPLEFDL